MISKLLQRFALPVALGLFALLAVACLWGITLHGSFSTEKARHNATQSGLARCRDNNNAFALALGAKNGTIAALESRIGECEGSKAKAEARADERQTIMQGGTVPEAPQQKGTVVNVPTRRKAADHINATDW